MSRIDVERTYQTVVSRLNKTLRVLPSRTWALPLARFASNQSQIVPQNLEELTENRGQAQLGRV